ncbi:hypothetical protein [Roseateles sp.]|uniref:hypothetical protein n=1 Tax=Roseateles sp. TaxID=1971397 RepID=UPI003266729D
MLLPEEQYNLRTPQLLLQIVTAHVSGTGSERLTWQIDTREPEAAWEQALAEFHAAMDQRFGEGQGMAVVLLENFDSLTEKLFGAKYALKTAPRGSATARRQAEERLRKLMNARGGRFMLVATATGSVDMDYERPLFQAFKPVDIQSWSPDTALAYFDKRRQLDGLPPLGPAQHARARAITEFIGGNPRLAQLLGSVLASPSAQTIAQTLDELVDRLADYYRDRLDSLPPAAAGLLDAIIRGGEPITQTSLGQRVGGEQRHVADAFSYLTRSRIVQPHGDIGAAQSYRVRDRLFVHFYRRRYSQSRGLAPIAELLERFFTAEEREEHIRTHLGKGEFEDALAFGRLPLGNGSAEYGYKAFRDEGITDGPDKFWFALSGADADTIPALRQQLRDAPDKAYAHWRARATQAATPLQAAAAAALGAVAASRQRLDQIALHDLDAGIAAARTSGATDALLMALQARYEFSSSCLDDAEGSAAAMTEMKELIGQAGPQPQNTDLRTQVCAWESAEALSQKTWERAQQLANEGLVSTCGPQPRMALLEALARAQLGQRLHAAALGTCAELAAVAQQHTSLDAEACAANLSCKALLATDQPAAAFEIAEYGAQLAQRLGHLFRHLMCLIDKGHIELRMENGAAACTTGRAVEEVATGLHPPSFEIAAIGVCLQYLGMAQQDALGQNTGSVMEAALRSLDHADRVPRVSTSFTNLVAATLGFLMLQAVKQPLPDVFIALDKALSRHSTLPESPSLQGMPDMWLAATARGQAWPQAAGLAAKHTWLLARTTPDGWAKSLRLTGEFWAEASQQQGRASAYAVVSAVLPALKTIWDLAPAASTDDSDKLLVSRLADMAVAVALAAKDPGLLRDIADLMQELWGTRAAQVVKALRLFADVRSDADPEQHLQQHDPDVVTAVRRILNLPPPAPVAKAAKRRKRSG